MRKLVLLLLLLLPTGYAALAQDSPSINLVGFVEAVGDDLMVVNGIIVDLTNVDVPEGLLLAQDAPIRVGGTLANGDLIATVVEPASPAQPLPDEAEIVGVPSGIDPDTIRILGQVIDTDEAEFAGFADDTPVTVFATLDAESGVWSARLVDYDRAADDAPPSLTATLEAVEDTGITLGGQQILLDDPTAVADLVEGALLVVIFEQTDGRIVLSEIDYDDYAIPASAAVVEADEIEEASDVGVLEADEAVVGIGEAEAPAGGDDAAEAAGIQRVLDEDGNCVVTNPGNWTTYTIRSGDILSDIAARGTATIAEIQAVNCIANANSIVAGATIFVPAQFVPPPSTPVDTGFDIEIDDGSDAEDDFDVDRSVEQGFIVEQDDDEGEQDDEG